MSELTVVSFYCLAMERDSRRLCTSGSQRSQAFELNRVEGIKQSLVGSGPCNRGYRFGLRLRLPVRLNILMLGGPDLDAAFQHSSVLHADTLGDHITR